MNQGRRLQSLPRLFIAQSLARRKRQSVNPDRELLGLGAANLGSALTGGFAVAGGFSRSSVNIEAGANTPLSASSPH